MSRRQDSSNVTSSGLDGQDKKSNEPRLLRTPPIKDRQSTFIAVFSPEVSVKSLQALPDFQSATHRAAAWRRPSSQQALTGNTQFYETGSDDDGEHYAGKLLARLLASMNVTGSVVVARWFGGVLLGPIRFRHIENAATEAIRLWQKDSSSGAFPRQQTSSSQAGEAAERSKLAQSLQERDHSIASLRELLAEKQGRPTNPTQSSPSKTASYSTMSLQVLQNLELARDRTIAWVLQEIDKAEAHEQVQVADGNA